MEGRGLSVKSFLWNVTEEPKTWTRPPQDFAAFGLFRSGRISSRGRFGSISGQGANLFLPAGAAMASHVDGEFETAPHPQFVEGVAEVVTDVEV